MTHKIPKGSRKSHIFSCDHCGLPLSAGKTEHIARRRAEYLARRDGWRMVGDSLMCPDCRHDWGPDA